MFECALCGRKLKLANGLSNHLTRKHPEVSAEWYYLKYINPTRGRCSTCGGRTDFVSVGVGYKIHCNQDCAANDPATKEKKRQTNIKKYGVPCNLNLDEVKEKAKSPEAMAKIQATTVERYGVFCALQQEYVKEKVKSKEVQDKIDQTVMKKYGTSRANIPAVREAANKASHTAEAEAKRQATMLKRHKIRFAFLSDEAKKKRYSPEVLAKVKATKLSHKTWNTSAVEKNFVDQLDKLGIMYEHPYKSREYPWNCDFYLKDYNIYIELNLFFTHGGHFYSNHDISDIQQAEKWKVSNSEFCQNAAINWTQTDILKRDTAIKNNLNYIVLWNKNQIVKFLASDFNFKGFVDFNTIREEDV